VSEFDPRREQAAIERIQAGLGKHAAANSRVQAVNLSDQLVSVDKDIAFQFDLQGLEADDLLSHVKANLDPNSLHSLRKIAEIIEDDFEVDIGHSKFARIASTASTLSSYVALALAGYNLLESAQKLDTAARNVESVSEIKDKRLNRFYRALCLFAAECFFLATPFSFKFAWKGTRFVNNRLLYKLRTYSPRLHRYIMSETHYAIRSLGKESLRSLQDFSSYLVTMTVQTLELIRDHSDKKINKVVSMAKTVAEEYQTFAQNEYSVDVPDVDLTSIAKDAVTKFDVDIELPAVATHDGRYY